MFFIGENLNETLNNKIMDISLLDVSRPEEFVWTNVFTPPPPPQLPSHSFGFVRPIGCKVIPFSWIIIYLFVSFIS